MTHGRSATITTPMKNLLKNLLTLVAFVGIGALAAEHRAVASLALAFVFSWISQSLLWSKLGYKANKFPVGAVLMVLVLSRLSAWWAVGIVAFAGHAVGMFWVQRRLQLHRPLFEESGVRAGMDGFIRSTPEQIFAALDPFLRTPRPFVVRAASLRPSRALWLARLRAWWLALLIRAALRLGMRALVVGRARTGKSFVLERAFPGRVVDGAAEFRRGGIASTPIDESRLPDGPFAIEELPGFNVDQLETFLPALRKRTFAMSLQHLGDIRLLGLEPLFAGRRTLILLIDGQLHP